MDARLDTIQDVLEGEGIPHDVRLKARQVRNRRRLDLELRSGDWEYIVNNSKIEKDLIIDLCEIINLLLMDRKAFAPPRKPRKRRK